MKFRTGNLYLHGLTLLLLSVTAVSASIINAAAAAPSRAWRTVDSLISDGLTKTALDTVEILFGSAKKNGDSEQMVKCLIYRMRLESYREEDAFVKACDRLRAEIPVAPFPASAILQSMLGECYRQYYLNNRRQFLSRSETVDFKNDDMHTWDLRTIIEQMTGAFTRSLEDVDRLKAVRLDDFGAAIIVHRDDSRLRPTLYDLLVHRALDFYSTGENELTRPSYEFTLTSADFFKPADRFIRLKFSSRDTASLKFRAIVLLQNLLAFHAGDPTPEAFIDADLKRLDLVREWSVRENKDSLYLGALAALAEKYTRFAPSTEVTCAIARLYTDWAGTWQPRIDERYRWMNREALRLCDRAADAFPNSFGSAKCAALANGIRSKQLSFTVESVNAPDTPFRALVSYANVNKIHWRIVAMPGDTFNDLMDRFGGDSVITILTSVKPVSRWSTPLLDPEDYQRHSTEVAMPPLSCGHYVILCSSSHEFHRARQAILWGGVQISRISFITRRRNDGSQEFHLLDRTTGQPLEGVTVTTRAQTYDRSERRFKPVRDGRYVSDAEGAVRIPVKKKKAVNYSIDFSLGSDRFNPGNRFYLYRHGESLKKMEPRTFFFTDRAVYRPGQTIYYKGIMLATDGDSSALLPGKSTTVTFYDVNGREVARHDLRTGSYGSVHGTFTAPAGVLNGRMYLTNGTGTAWFSVEEYKRPKFSVAVEPPGGTPRLGDTVKIAGKAVSYTGAPVDGAQVRYRIVRKARFPDYWWRRWRPARWSADREICGGTAVSNDTGGFSISFTALPDLSVPRKEHPVFSFSVSVDVTDITGETRSTTRSIDLGYNSLILTAAIPRLAGVSVPLTGSVTATNCSGEKMSASGSIRVYRLSTPSTPYRSRLWQRPDTAVIAAAEYRRLFPVDQYADELDITSWHKDKKVADFTFDTKSTTEFSMPRSTKWQPGAYMAIAASRDDRGNEVSDTRYFTLYNEKGKRPPWPAAQWCIPVKNSGEPGEQAVFLVGTGCSDVFMFYEIEHKGEIIQKEWFTLNNGQRRITIPIEEKHRGGFTLHVCFTRNGRCHRLSEQITVPWSNKRLQLAFETFRDRLLPGTDEQWKIRISGPDGEKRAAEMVATLYDASLDAFAPHGWPFSIYPTYTSALGWNEDGGFSIRRAYSREPDWNEHISPPTRNYPALDWFGYGFKETHSVGRRGVAGIGYGGGYGSGYGGSSGIDDLIGSNEIIPSPAPAPRVPARRMLAKSAAAEDFAKGGFAEGIDAVLDGTAGLKAGEGGTPGQTIQPDLSTVIARSNLNETAFFYPDLTTNEKGEVIIKFTVPEALTRWNMLGFAHTKDLCFGETTNHLVTCKELMVVPNAPRFFRENDRIVLTAKVVNLSDSSLAGTAQLFLSDAATMRPVDAAFGNTAARVPFKAKKGQSAPLSWEFAVPEGIGAVSVKVVAAAGSFTDGEKQLLPVLSNRMLVTESIPLSIRNGGTRDFTLPGLVSMNNGSNTLRNHRLTLEFNANPVWYAIQALPYLIEYPYECAEQVFSRVYANAIASHIVNASPEIKAVFDQWRKLTPETLLSGLEKNSELKSLVLEETPWLLDGRNESERKQRISVLFDLNRMAHEKEHAVKRLRKMQLANGGWPWFDGMPDNRYITQYIVTGFGRLDRLGIELTSNGRKLDDMIDRALRYCDERIREDYEAIIRDGDEKRDNLDETHLQYLYMRSFFGPLPVTAGCREAFDYFLESAKKYGLKKRRYMQAMTACALNRYGETATALKIMRSLKENAVTGDETGMYWKEMYEGYSWWWYEAPIESQALMVEAFDEVSRDTAAVEALKVWLLKSRQTQNWPTTRSTAEACYALLLRGLQWTETATPVTITLGNEKIDPAGREDAGVEAGTGYFKTSWSGNEIRPEMGNVSVSRSGPGVAWGALYWQYFEQMDKIKKHETPLELSKKLFLEQVSATGPRLVPVAGTTGLKPGDRIRARIELRVDRDMEYVHMKDLRASGLEPVNVFSGYRRQDGLDYYESTRDAATSFFFSRLNKGTYVFEYPLMVTHSGSFSNGIAAIQCMYAPEFTAHSEGVKIAVGK